MLKKIDNAEKWLSERRKGIGGSDAGAVIGVNHWKSNIDLWREKTAPPTTEYETIDRITSAIRYGKDAEKFLREMFKLDFRQYTVDYHEFWLYISDTNPFMFCTLDGEITGDDGKKGILEIKTTTIQNSSQWAEWDDKIPDSYYAQIIHQLICTGWDFAILKAHINYTGKDGTLRAAERHYFFDRTEPQIQADMVYLIEKERQFWECVESNTQPALMLPKI